MTAEAYCTLFDSNYLSRGLVMAESLHRHSPQAHLYIVAFDDVAYRVLQALALPATTIIPLRDFESPELLQVKPSRSKAEYCWTATPALITYCLETFGLKRCTYLDADLVFFDDPQQLLDELKGDSVLITEHRYTPIYDQSATSGIYCVQFITFPHGSPVLRWWKDACLEWCYATLEDGKFGDQKYLDDWTTRFQGIRVLAHLGGGLAPWNVQQYTFRREGEKIVGTEVASGARFEAVFYHFHHVRYHPDGTVDLGPYHLPEEVKTLFYRPYLRELEAAKQRIAQVDDSFDPHGPRPLETHWKTPFRRLKQRLEGRYNIFPVRKLLELS